MSVTSANSADSWRSQFLGAVGAMHGIKLIIAPHIVVLIESAKAQSAWLAFVLLSWMRTRSVHTLHRSELALAFFN